MEGGAAPAPMQRSIHICTHEPDLAAHHARLISLESRQDRHDDKLDQVGDKIDNLKTWLMGALLVSLMTLIGELLRGMRP